jgi:hypothetical protein
MITVQLEKGIINRISVWEGRGFPSKEDGKWKMNGRLASVTLFGTETSAELRYLLSPQDIVHQDGDDQTWHVTAEKMVMILLLIVDEGFKRLEPEVEDY